METKIGRKRSNSLDLNKVKDMDLGLDRVRNDSGCFEDFDLSPTGNGSHDPVVAYWEEAVNQWSERARSVIAQEVVRMNEMTRKMKRDFLLKQEPKEKVHNTWKLHMKETMDLANDLMKCVSYDILEEFGSDFFVTEDFRKAEKSLTKITEEDDMEHTGKTSHSSNRVFIIKVDHRIRRARTVPKHKVGLKGPFIKPQRGGRTKVNKSTMNYLLEELKELRKMVGIRKESGKLTWGCEQCLSKEDAWEDIGSTDSDSVEDIFADWVSMLKRSSVDLNANDINDVFWNIESDQVMSRTRRISEILDDMPFSDRPDIFQDRCEILESYAKAQRISRKPKCYWNIFSDWCSNLKEPTDWSRKRRVKAYWDIFDDWKFIFDDSPVSVTSKHAMTPRAYWNIFSDWKSIFCEPLQRPLFNIVWNWHVSNKQDQPAYWNIFRQWRFCFREPLDWWCRKSAMKGYWDFFGDWKFNLQENPCFVPKVDKANKAYWNIFKEWKSNLDEPENWMGKKPKAYWNYFKNWKHNLDERKVSGKERPTMGYWKIFRDWKFNLDEPRARPAKDHEIVKCYWNLFRDWKFNLDEKSHLFEPRIPLPKCYWNIFKDWKQNLEEVDHPAFSSWQLLERKKNAHNVKAAVKRDRRDLPQEEYFEDWRHCLEDDAGQRRRSLAEIEDDELIISSSPFKKIKQDFFSKHRPGKSVNMAFKFGRAYLGMKRNMTIALGNTKLMENFDFWQSDEAVEAMLKTHSEFCHLRYEMRQQRQWHRELNDVIAPESWMEEWRWNLDEDSPTNISLSRRRASEPARSCCEDIFADWRRISLGDCPFQDEEYETWMHNLKKRSVKNRTLGSRLDPSTSSKVKQCKAIIPSLLPMPPAAAARKAPSKISMKKLKHPQAGLLKAEKKAIRTMVKCHAKQPRIRGRN